MAKRNNQSIEPAPVIEAQGDPSVEALASAETTSEAPVDSAAVESAAEAPAQTRGVATLSANECRSELARLGDPVASRKALRRGLDKLITDRTETIKALDAQISAAEREYRVVLDQSQDDAERVRQILAVRLPQLEAADAAAAASGHAMAAQAESTLEREALL